MLSVDRNLAGRVEAMFEEDFARSVEVVHNELDSRNALYRIGAAAARLLSPIL